MKHILIAHIKPDRLVVELTPCAKGVITCMLSMEPWDNKNAVNRTLCTTVMLGDQWIQMNGQNGFLHPQLLEKGECLSCTDILIGIKAHQDLIPSLHPLLKSGA